MDLESIRREYLKGGLRRESLHDDPRIQFERWMDNAIHSEVPDPTAMTLATVSASGEPTQRIVLLKHADDKGFVFYTNYSSRKALDIAANNQVSLHFPWHFMERQVKINGFAHKVPVAESLAYFLSRPHDSQVAAWSSEQSQAVSSRQLLETQFARMKAKFKQGQVPLPDFWGGFRIEPYRYEFWQGGAMRLHDRFEYVKEKTSWRIQRLAP
ncbi:pyridoxamine 5'-phosphate oxidase [Marinagarivorans algicola]|uniref:pyridoxamine 5'-phosphate oxidase n=1 Tax=Marinagarivorans algicola TaxID=1513270 RepID=UPI003736969D